MPPGYERTETIITIYTDLNWNVLLARSYVPYSGKPAACIVKGSSGNFYAGVRIENSSFSLTIAEDQAAICCCLSEGDHPVHFILHPDDHSDRSNWIKQFSLSTEHRDLQDISLYMTLADHEINPYNELASLLKKAVAPNSNFNVSALLKTSDGYITGVNTEFENWQQGLCAERLALAKAYAWGYRSFFSLHIHAEAGDFISPCGACRQVLLEHLPHNPIHLHHADGTHSIYFSDQLLPFYRKFR